MSPQTSGSDETLEVSTGIPLAMASSTGRPNPSYSEGNAKSLARAIRARGRIDPVVVGSARELPALLPDVLHDGDLLLVMGAGDIGHIANDIANKGFEGASQA